MSIRETHDLAPMLESLPGGNCSCPHWGYLFKGRMIVRYDDHEEVLEAGDAFYMSPGHAPEAEAGSEFVAVQPGRSARGDRGRHREGHAGEARQLNALQSAPDHRAVG